MRAVWRAVALGALVGAVAGPMALSARYAIRPALDMEMDRDAHRLLTGVYDVERAGSETFVWSRRTATLDLRALDRRVPWTCTVRVRAGRGEPLTLPEVVLAVDGRVAITHQTTNDFDAVSVPIPPDDRAAGLRLTLTTSDTFRPGPNDTRELGAQIGSIRCAPDARHRPGAPARALGAAAVGASVFGVAAALTGLGVAGTLAVVLAVAAGQSLPLAWATGPYSAYVHVATMLSIGIALAMMAGVRVGEFVTAVRWSRTARGVAALSAVAAYLKLLALVHPSKLLIDAVFQAHRLQWILEGRFYFTQPLPSGVDFPYAIALYLFAAPFTLVTSDYVTLLRIIVVGAEAVALALLYPMIVRTWRDKAAGITAVAFGHLVPLPYVVIGNANLPNVFGQALALMSVAAATTLAFGSGRRRPLVLLFALAAGAMLSHVSTFALLATILGAMAILYIQAAGATLRPEGRAVLIATVAAALFSIGTYYGHFAEVYQRLERLRATTTADAGAIPQTGVAPGDVRNETVRSVTPSTLPSRAGGAFAQSIDALGWPLVILAAGGLATLRAAPRDRLTLAIAAFGAAYAVFWIVGVVPRVEGPFERYVAEFIGRVVYATYPAVVILAAVGTARAVRAGRILAALAALLVTLAGVVGVRAWWGWVL